MRLLLIGFTALLIILFTTSCFDEEFIDDSSAMLGFSTDTVTFDTVFTTIGSTTKQLRLFNPYNKYLNISNIYLAGGENSFFRLNIDGERASSVENIEIAPKDSIYIFIEVTVDPLGVNNPLVINDSIVFITNGNVQDVNLVAYGQDVHLIDGQVIETETWIADKPYLIYNSMAVDSSHTLTIEAGTILYFHESSSMYILGNLIVNGTFENPVVFRGDRLDEVFPGLSYDFLPDQWSGLVIYPYSQGNRLTHCIIKNAEIGLFLPGVLGADYQSEIELRNTVIQNNSYAGIYALNSKITAFNCLIINNGNYSFAGFTGGEYKFYNSTISNHFISFNQGIAASPAVILTNFVYYNDSLIQNDLKNTGFVNCIIEGQGPNQLQIAGLPERELSYLFKNCLIEVIKDSVDHENTTLFLDNIFNEDPGFKKIPLNDEPSPDRYIFNFSLDTLSPAKDKGDPAIITQFPELEFDILGNSRLLDEGPDIGAYERIE